jgi:hypothetical protein
MTSQLSPCSGCRLFGMRLGSTPVRGARSPRISEALSAFVPVAAIASTLSTALSLVVE